MSPAKIAELEAAAAAAKKEADDAEGKNEELNQKAKDAEEALQKAKTSPPITNAPSHKPERTEKEKAAFSLKKNAERFKELGGDPAEVLLDEENDDQPLTRGDLKRIQIADARKSALQMAQELPEDEREDVISALANRVVPSGNPEQDLQDARSIANRERNARISAMAGDKGKPQRTAAGGSSPAQGKDESELTPEEMVFTRPPYNLSKEKIIAKRPK